MEEEQKISILGFSIWIIASLFFLYEFFLRTFLGTVADQVITQLHLTPERFALLGVAYFISYGVMQLPVGILVDRFGVKLVMLVAVLICSVATFAFACSTTFIAAFISRFFMGFGSAFAFVCLIVVAMRWFPRRHFGLFAGLSQLIGTMGPLLAGGPLLDFIMKMHETWRIALIQIAIFGIILAGFVMLFVKNKPMKAVAGLPVQHHSKKITQQLKQLLTNPQVWFIAIFSGAVYVSIALLGAVWGTHYLETKGFSQEASAYMVSIVWLGYAIGCPLLGFCSDIMKRRKPMLVLSTIMGFGSIIAILSTTMPSKFVFTLAFFVLGLAAAGQNVGFVTIAEQVGPEIKSTAIGFNNAMITVFDALLVSIVSLFIILPKNHIVTSAYASKSFSAFLVLPILYFIAFIISMFCIKETYCRSQQEHVILAQESGEENA